MNQGPMVSAEYQLRKAAVKNMSVTIYMNMTYEGNIPTRPSHVDLYGIDAKNTEYYWKLVNP